MTMSHSEWTGLLIILTITWTVRRYDRCEAVNSMRWSTHYKATQVSSWILTSCQPRRVTPGLITHYITIPSHQLRTQVTSSQADSCTTALDAPQSTANAIKSKKGRQEAKSRRRRTDQEDHKKRRRKRKKSRRAQVTPMLQLHASCACTKDAHQFFFINKHGDASTCRSECKKYWTSHFVCRDFKFSLSLSLSYSYLSVCGIVVLIRVCSIARTGCQIGPNRT